MASAEMRKRPMLQHALEYRALGYPIFPVCSPAMGKHQHYDDAEKRSKDCVGDKVGKHPMASWKACQTALPSAAQVKEWWTRWPTANIGMATGALSGVIVLDCDSGEARQLALDRGGLERTPAVWTGKPGGTHFWMAHPGYEVRNFAKDIPGTDFRGDGGYVLLPPSLHYKGATYRWAENTLGMKPAPVPPWLDELFQAKAAGSTSDGDRQPLDLDEILKGIKQGERDTKLYKYAHRLRHDDVPQEHAEMMLRLAARACDPAFPEDEAVEKVRRAYHDFPPGGAGPTVEVDEFFSPPSSGARVDEPPVDPATFVFMRPISHLLSMPEEDPAWMVQQLFTEGSNGWIGAEPKIGKSWLGLELAYCLATGMPFLGKFAVPSRRKVFYIQEEDSRTRVRRRLGQIVRGDPSRIPPPDEFFSYSVREGFRIDSPTWVEILRRDIVAASPDVVILDVFNRLHGKDENSQKEMSEILAVLTDFTKQYGCAFIVVHHNRKHQQGNEARGNQMMRGSGVLASWGECSLYLRNGKEKNSFIVTPESKDAPEIDDFQVTIADQPNDGVLLEVADLEASAQMPKGDIDAIAAVEKITRQGIGATIKLICAELNKDRSTVQVRLGRLVKAGYLTATPISSTHNPTIIYAVVSQ